MPDPSTPISDEAVEAAAKVLAISRYQNPTSFYRRSVKAQEAEIESYKDRARAALEAAAPFMGQRHGVLFGEGPDGIFSVCVDGDMYAPTAELDAAEAKAATLAAQIEAVKELVKRLLAWKGVYEVEQVEAVFRPNGPNANPVWLDFARSALGSTETREP